MKAVADRIWIEKVEVKTTTPSGFQVSEFRQKPQQGKIVAVGPDCKTAKEGSNAIYAKGAGTAIFYNEKEYIVMREADLFATD